MNIIIAGAHGIGFYLARLLSRNHEELTLIDEDAEQLDKIGQDYDLMTYRGDVSSVKTLRDAGVAEADLFIAVTPNDNENINACIMAHSLGVKKTVAKVNEVEYTEPSVMQLYKGVGVDEIIYSEGLAARYILNGLKMSWVRQRWDVHDGALVMLGIKLRNGCEILNRPLREICGPQDPYHVVAIRRREETVIPGGNDMLQHMDLAYFMTTKQYIPYIRQITDKVNYVDVKNVMVMGGGDTTVQVLQNLPNYMHAKVFEKNLKRCEELNQLLDNDTLVICRDARNTSLLTEEGIRSMQAFVALTGNTEANILACLAARRLGVRRTIVRVDNTDYIDMAESLDIGTIVDKSALTASRIYQMMLDTDVLDVTFLQAANADVAEFVVKENSKVTRKEVKDLKLPRGITIGGLVRDGEGMLVSGNTRIQPGDSVVVICHNVNIKKVEQLFI